MFGQDSKDKTARAELPDLKSEERANRTRQPEQDSQNRTARQDSQTGQPEWDSRNGNVAMGLSERRRDR